MAGSLRAKIHARDAGRADAGEFLSLIGSGVVPRRFCHAPSKSSSSTGHLQSHGKIGLKSFPNLRCSIELEDCPELKLLGVGIDRHRRGGSKPNEGNVRCAREVVAALQIWADLASEEQIGAELIDDQELGGAEAERIEQGWGEAERADEHGSRPKRAMLVNRGERAGDPTGEEGGPAATLGALLQLASGLIDRLPPPPAAAMLRGKPPWTTPETTPAQLLGHCSEADVIP